MLTDMWVLVLVHFALTQPMSAQPLEGGFYVSEQACLAAKVVLHTRNGDDLVCAHFTFQPPR